MAPSEHEVPSWSPSASARRQARTAFSPFTSTRQSKHVPMPQKSPRCWPPRRVVRQPRSPLASSAPATVVPGGAVMSRPSKRKWTDCRPPVCCPGCDRARPAPPRGAPFLKGGDGGASLASWPGAGAGSMTTIAPTLFAAEGGPEGSAARGAPGTATAGSRQNRDGKKAAMSTVGVSPSAMFCTSSAVTWAKPTPAPSWPVACSKRPTSGSAPMMGSRSGVAGRKPT